MIAYRTTGKKAAARLLAACFLVSTAAFSQVLDETWRVTVGGQTVQVNPDGSFAIPNVSAPDQFGPSGPGSAPDFLGDDFVRVFGVSTFGGETRYVFSEPFQIRQDGTISISDSDLTFTDIPPLFPDSIVAVAGAAVLTGIGTTTQMVVTATLPNGMAQDVTPRIAWTSYRSSNAAIVTVDGDGLVTAIGEGIAFITAVNEGATSVARITVSPGDPLTDVEGIVRFEDGTAAGGASVSIPVQDRMVTSDSDGRFEISGVAAELTPTLDLSVTLQVDPGGPMDEFFIGGAAGVVPIPGGITDAGIIMLQSATTIDTDGDGVSDAIEMAMGTDPNDPDTDGDGISDGDEDLDGDGLPDWVEFVLQTDPSLADTDGNGVDDGDEDADGDGLTNLEEVLLGIDPSNVDTDGDGFFDGDELDNGSDPLLASSRPSGTSSSAGVSYAFFGSPGQAAADSRFSSAVVSYAFFGSPGQAAADSRFSSAVVSYSFFGKGAESATGVSLISRAVSYQF